MRVIKNAQNYTKGGELYQYLGVFLKKLQISHHIDQNILEENSELEETKSAIFQRSLDHFIEEVRTFQQTSPATIAAFNTHIFPRQCQEIQASINALYVLATEFSWKLELANSPPLVIVAYGLQLLEEVNVFSTKLASLATLVQKFYQNYAYSLSQPAKQLKDISQRFNFLTVYCTTILKRAEELRSKL